MKLFNSVAEWAHAKLKLTQATATATLLIKDGRTSIQFDFIIDSFAKSGQWGNCKCFIINASLLTRLLDALIATKPN